MNEKITGKILAAVFVVLFLISSIGPANAGISDNQVKSIEKSGSTDSETGTADQKPILILDDAGSNDISAVSGNLNQIGQISAVSGNLNQIGQGQLQGQPYQQPSEKYAVIMVGKYYGIANLLQMGYYILHPDKLVENIRKYYTWYLRDAARMYTTLQDVYGYDNDSIFLLVKLLPEQILIPGVGTYHFNIPEEFDPDWIDNISTEENLESVLNSFKEGGENELTENDQLFFCFIDHGGNENPIFSQDFYKPNGHDNTNWFFEEKTYDLSPDTKAIFCLPKFLWNSPYSDWLTLTYDDEHEGGGVIIKGFRICAKNDESFDKMEIIFYNDGNPVSSCYTFTDWPDNKWMYHKFEGEEFEVDKVKIRFHKSYLYYNEGFNIHPAKVSDFGFFQHDCDGEVGFTYFGLPFELLGTLKDILETIFCDIDNNGDEKLFDYELKEYCTGIKAKIIFALQPCFSGGFIRELALSGDDYTRIVCTASRGFELADAAWIGPFRKALQKYDGDNNGIPDADYNNDTKISILEAYRYAAEQVEEQLNTHPEFPAQHPLIDDNGDGIGHHFYETNYYGTSPGKDGCLADQTFL